MKKGNFISLRKLESINKFDGALFDGYSIKGHLIDDVVIGGKILIARSERNGIVIPGIFESTVIKNIDGKIVETGNSRWEIENLN